jgi:hypothetical protein
MEVFPNPAAANSEVFITSAQVARVELFNLSGQRVGMAANNRISLRGLSQGVYIARITAEDGAVYSRQLVIQ